MAKRKRRRDPTIDRVLAPLRTRCPTCGGPLWIAYATTRTVVTRDGPVHFTVKVRRCTTPSCARYHRPYRPEEEGGWALPHSEFGLDVIAWLGIQRYTAHQTIPELHQALRARGLDIAERTVTHLVQRYDELLALRLAAQPRLRARLREQGRVLLALDGLQPDVGHEVVWLLRDCLSGEVLLARSLLSATQEDLTALLREVQQALPVPIQAVLSDGQHSIRRAVRAALPGIPHQLCQFHYLREAAKPISEADRHAKKELKKQVRGVRPLERQLEARTDPAAHATRAYCLAVRSALTDDGYPPLCAAGLRLYDRLHAIEASLRRVIAATGAPPSCSACRPCSRGGLPRRLPSGPRCAAPTAGYIRRPSYSRMAPTTMCSPYAAPTASCSPRWRTSGPPWARWRRPSTTSAP
jgi:Transposase, Mutator family